MMIGALLFFTLVAITCISFSVGTTESTFSDQEQDVGNLYGAWTSVQWTQTTQSDYNAGSLTNVSTSVSPGDVKLANTTNYSGWYNPSWNFRKKITIDGTKVAATQTNFPVLISFTTDADLASSALANGNDILFTSADGTTKLDHEIENFTVSNGKLIAWVRVPSLSSTTNTVLYLYFNNSGSSNQQNATGVWDANYAAVYHMSQSPAGTVNDSTSNRLNLTSGGGMGAGNLVSGQIGNAIIFDGSNDRLTSSTTFTTQSFTLEAWVSHKATGYWGVINPSGTAGYNSIIDIDNTTIPDSRDFTTCPNGGLYGYLCLSNSSADLRIADRQRGTTWTHVIARYNNSGTSLTGFINGTQTSYTTTLSEPSITGRVIVGAWYMPSSYYDFWNGTIDEVRISKNARSNQWIGTGYNNTYSPSTFYSLGAKESPPENYVSSGTLASQVKDTGETGARWDALEWDEGLAGGTDITFGVRASDTSFLKDNTTLSWTSVGGTSPVYTLPNGRYFQWRATLTTADTSLTPVLNEVRAYYT